MAFLQCFNPQVYKLLVNFCCWFTTPTKTHIKRYHHAKNRLHNQGTGPPSTNEPLADALPRIQKVKPFDAFNLCFRYIATRTLHLVDESDPRVWAGGDAGFFHDLTGYHWDSRSRWFGKAESNNMYAMFLFTHLYMSSYNQLRIPLVTGLGLVMMKFTQESKRTFSGWAVFFPMAQRNGHRREHRFCHVMVSAFFRSRIFDCNKIWAPNS